MKEFELIRLSQDRKVQGFPKEKNSFGLPVFTTCPGRTKACEAVCYAKRGTFTFPAAKKMYQENYGALQTILLKMPVVEAGAYFAKEIEKHNRGGIFRWNISGDVFSTRYWSMMIYIAMILPKITFWVYTRSFDEIQWAKTCVPENLRVILSFDKDNKSRAKNSFVNAVCDDRLISWMGDIKEAKKVFPSRKWFTCPELTKKIP